MVNISSSGGSNGEPAEKNGAGSTPIARKDEGAKMVVRSAKVEITGQTHRTDYVHENGDPNGKVKQAWVGGIFKKQWVTGEANGNGLALAYHLRLDSYYAMKAGPKQQGFAACREWDHPQDMLDRKDHFQDAADSLVGRSFRSTNDATRALSGAVDPVVRGAWIISGMRDFTGQHTLKENGSKVDFYQ